MMAPHIASQQSIGHRPDKDIFPVRENIAAFRWTMTRECGKKANG
jgi:hypothetical protein